MVFNNSHSRLTLITVFTGCILYIACGQSLSENHSDSGSDTASESQEARQFLTGADLKIWSKVDTSGKKAEVLAALRTYFDQKMQALSAEAQDYWMPEAHEQFIRDYAEIRYAEYGSDAKVQYWPTVLEIEAIEGEIDQYFATVRWASLDSLGAPDIVRYVFTFWVKPDPQGMLRLAAPTETLTAAWRKESVGDVTFVLSPKHQFSRKQAEEQQSKIEELQAFFEVESFPITFYSFRNPTELLQTRGYVQHPMFYKFETGGQAGVGDVVYSGNDRDEYVHEVVHLFISRKIPESTGLLNEGLATLMGGSSGQPYAWHLEKLRAWLLANPDVDLTQHLNPYQAQYIEEDTSIPYVIGAVLCEKLLQEHGKEVLFKALAEGADPWAFLTTLGLEKENLRLEILRTD